MKGVIIIHIYYDTEFLERGPNYPIELISIGMVREDGAELYLINDDAPWNLIHEHEWLEKNVVPHLENEQALWADQKIMRREVYSFLMGWKTKHNQWPELFAWYSAYDHVCLAQIFGRMIDLPVGIPMFTHDVRSMADWYGVKSWPKQTEGNHNALEDARHLRKVYNHIMEVGKLSTEKLAPKN